MSPAGWLGAGTKWPAGNSCDDQMEASDCQAQCEFITSFINFPANWMKQGYSYLCLHAGVCQRGDM